MRMTPTPRAGADDWNDALNDTRAAFRDDPSGEVVVFLAALAAIVLALAGWVTVLLLSGVAP